MASLIPAGGRVSNLRRVECNLSYRSKFPTHFAKISKINAQRSRKPSKNNSCSSSSSSSSRFCCCRNELQSDHGKKRIHAKKEDMDWGNFGLKQFQAVATKFGDMLMKLLVSVLNNTKKIDEDIDKLYAECSWERWQEYFEIVEREEETIALMKLHLEDSVKREDFEKAAALKRRISETATSDTASEVISQLKKAVEEERYQDAAKLRDATCVGMVGWWAGVVDSGNDPYGRIIRISPEYGKFVAKSYNARQLASAGPGVPLFEIFVAKNNHQEYDQQAVYLQQNGKTAQGSLAGSLKAAEESETDIEKIDDAELGDEGLRQVLKFLRAGIPGLKFKVSKVATPERADTDIISGIFDQLFQDINKEDDENDLHNERGINDVLELIEIAATKLAFGSLLRSIAEDAPPNVPVRVPAKIEKRDHNTFCFHIEDDGNQQSARGMEMTPSWKVATVAKQTSADLSDDVTKIPWINEKDSSKALQDFGEIITLAVTEARKRRGLHGSTVFHRINVEAANADPFCGLYIGTFGPYPPEVIQLRRRYGQWHDDSDGTPNKNSKLEFFEYVEAVKLTGDMIVPAGQVAFRAKIGKECQLSHRDIFPEELGVVARYKGQERRAQSGFRKNEWTDAELLLLNEKGTDTTAGPRLGFLLYAVPEHPFLVLLQRLNLSE